DCARSWARGGAGRVDRRRTRRDLGSDLGWRGSPALQLAGRPACNGADARRSPDVMRVRRPRPGHALHNDRASWPRARHTRAAARRRPCASRRWTPCDWTALLDVPRERVAVAAARTLPRPVEEDLLAAVAMSAYTPSRAHLLPALGGNGSLDPRES